MAGISDILLARGAAQANAASRRGNIYADVIRQSTSAPGQVAQQLRADQRAQAQDEETKARLGLAQGQLAYQTSALQAEQAQTQRNQAGQAALSSAIQKHTTTDDETGHITIDHDAVYKDVAAVAPDIADHWLKGQADHLRLTNEIQNDTIAAAQKKAQLGANIAGSVADAAPDQRAAAYDAARTQALTLYKDVPEISGPWQKLPPVYSPSLDATLMTIRDSGTSAAQKAEAALKKAQENKAAAETAKVQKETEQIGKPPEMTPYQKAEISLRTRELGTKEADAKAKADEKAAALAKGKPLPAIEADKISDLKKSVAAVDDLSTQLQQGATGSLAAFEANHVPQFVTNLTGIGAEAKATKADIVRAQQIVGRILHGGVLRKNDQEAAAAYMPQQDDSPAVIKSKLDKIREYGRNAISDHVSNLGKSGYDVSNFQEVAAPTAPAAAPGALSVQAPNGKTYTFTSQADADAFRAKAGL